MFVQKYLIPRYGLEETKKYPMVKTGPWRDLGDNLSEALGVKEPDLNQETWLVVPEDRFAEVEKCLLSYAEKNNKYLWQPEKSREVEEEIKKLHE